MLGKAAICPLCKKQFQLQYESSVEYRREQESLREREEEEMGQRRLVWAIVAAVIVALGVILLIGVSTR